MASLAQRLRLCDPFRKNLPSIKEKLRKKVSNSWINLTEKELKRIRAPCDAFSKEMTEGGYPETSEYLRHLLSLQDEETGTKDTSLVDNPTLLTQTTDCLKKLEDCHRSESSSTQAINELTTLSVKIAPVSKWVAKKLFQIALNKFATHSLEESLKNKVRFLFGKFLVERKEYEAANVILKEALEESVKNNLDELIRKICGVYYDSLYNLSSLSAETDKDLAYQLADDAYQVALKMNDPHTLVRSLIQRGNISFSIANYAEAIIDFQSAVTELSKRFNIELKLEILYNLSSCYFITQNYDLCLLTLGALGRLSMVYKNLVYQAHFHRIDGKVKLLTRNNVIARRNFLKANQIYNEIGLPQLAKSCQYLAAIAECEFLIDPWIEIIIMSEKDRDFASRYELNKAMISIFNWKEKREYFCESMS